MSSEAKQQIAEGLAMMQALLHARLADIKQGVSLQIREKTLPLTALDH